MSFRTLSIGLGLLLLPAALAANYEVTVGAGGQLKFDPETVSASAGDSVTFTFNPKAHSVTQSAFASPCAPLAGGFDSGLTPVTEGSNGPTFQVAVNDSTTPVWVYCKQQGPPAHCGQGMVFAINAPADPDPHSFSKFQALAQASNSSSSNTTGTSTSASSSYITPPAPSVVTVTATVTDASSTWTTVYGSYVGSASPTPAAQPVTHNITVGANGQLAFSPSNISASIGDTVIFEFHAKNHTVTQASFLKPCQPLQDTSATGQVGFASGFMPVSQDATTFPTFSIKINDTAPVWGYCAQQGPPDHCGSGMVFSVNAIESGPNNFAAFQSLAKQINGTGSASGSASSPSSSSKSGAVARIQWKGPSLVSAVLVSFGFLMCSL